MFCRNSFSSWNIKYINTKKWFQGSRVSLAIKNKAPIFNKLKDICLLINHQSREPVYRFQKWIQDKVSFLLPFARLSSKKALLIFTTDCWVFKVFLSNWWSHLTTRGIFFLLNGVCLHLTREKYFLKYLFVCFKGLIKNRMGFV